MNPFRQPRAVIGMMLIALGIIFIGMNIGVVESRPLHHFWPVIIILIGIGKLMQAGNGRERWGGAWLIMLGLWLQVSVLQLFDFSFHNSWPLLLIIFGIYIAGKAMAKQSYPGLAKENGNGQ